MPYKMASSQESGLTKLRYLNFGAAALHLVLLAVLAWWKFTNDTVTDAPLFDTTYSLENRNNAGLGESCKKWFVVSIEKTGGKIDIWSLTAAFTIITIFAHVAYSSLLIDLYQSQIKIGRNPMRWIEYFMSATLMAIILALTAAVRIEALIVLVAVSTAGQMLQGFTIETAISQFKKWYSFDVLLPLIAGWGLFAAAWYTIISQWYRGFSAAETIYDPCPDDLNPYKDSQNSGRPPEFLMHFIWIVFAFFVSFGIVNLAHIGVAATQSNNLYFWKIETAYIALSFASKAVLILYGTFTVFSELEWLQVCGAGDEPSKCQTPYLPSYDNFGNKL